MCKIETVRYVYMKLQSVRICGLIGLFLQNFQTGIILFCMFIVLEHSALEGFTIQKCFPHRKIWDINYILQTREMLLVLKCMLVLPYLKVYIIFTFIKTCSTMAKYNRLKSWNFVIWLYLHINGNLHEVLYCILSDFLWFSFFFNIKY
jgi:hypothetical protein